MSYVDDLLERIRSFRTEADARAFMASYRRETPRADDNVGYVSGYLSDEEGERIRSWCSVRHPIFGDDLPKDPELRGRFCYLMGVRMGAAGRHDKEFVAQVRQEVLKEIGLSRPQG